MNLLFKIFRLLKQPKYQTVFILCIINMLNYMDRYAVAAVLLDIQKFFIGIDNKSIGLIQTVFICSYMLFAPIAGYLGDKKSRKTVIITGVFIWSVMAFVSSLVGKNKFWLFLIFRSLVGIGEASYSTVAPTIFADLFPPDFARAKQYSRTDFSNNELNEHVTHYSRFSPDEIRLMCLSAFYFAIPVGSGAGYILSSWMAHKTGSWAWGLRVTPVVGSFLLYIFYRNVHNIPPSPKKRVKQQMPNDLDNSFTTQPYKEPFFAPPTSDQSVWIDGEREPLLVVNNNATKTFANSQDVGSIDQLTHDDSSPCLGRCHNYCHDIRNVCYGIRDWIILDVRSLLRIPTFRWVSMGITWVSFVTGALALWAPTFMQLSANSRGNPIPVTEEQIGLRFGLITCLAGAIGLIGGSELARRFKARKVAAVSRLNTQIDNSPVIELSPSTLPGEEVRIDPLVCGFSLIAASPILMGALYLAKFTAYSFYPFSWLGLAANWSAWIAIFLAECGFCSCWALVVDITLSVVPVEKRSTSQALQMLISHAFGDASSSYIIGAISQTLLDSWTGQPRPTILPPVQPVTTTTSAPILPSFAQKFRSLQYALYITPFAGIFGAISFLRAAFTIQKDLAAVKG